MPALLFSTLASAGFTGLTVLPMAAAVVTTILIMTMLLFAVRRAFEGPAYTSLFQGSLRQNTYIGLALANGLFGGPGLAAAALAVGAGLQLAGTRADGRKLTLACLFKLAVMPALAALACWTFDARGVAASVAILFSALPAATSSYILARQLGGDARLMARIITLQTAVSAASLPLVLIVLT